MAENRVSISSQDDPTCDCQFDHDRSPSRLSRVSSTSSRTTFTREEVTIMNDSELDTLCKQVFALCDANGDGFISKDELVAQCGEDDPELLQQLMETMDTNKDGRISLDEFRSGLDIVSKHLSMAHSTPKDKQVILYEHEPLSDEDEEAWFITMERIDPNGYISDNKELRSVWTDLLSKDSHLLDKFELFLSNIVEELSKSHSDVEQIERRMKQVLTNHSKEVSEMDGILNEQIQEVYVQQQAKSQQTSDKLNDQYRDLLAERDILIASLAEQEKTLQHKLYEKVQNEQELRNERIQLLHLNRSLQNQLSDSYKQLSVSQREIQRLSLYEKDEGKNCFNVDEPLMESSLPLSEYQSESMNSLSSQNNINSNMLTLSPPPPELSFINSSTNTFKSPSLAFEVAEALKQATPTLSYSSSVTPTGIEDDEKRNLLDSVSSDDELMGLSHTESHDSNGYVLVDLQNDAHTDSPIPIPSNIQAQPSLHQSHPSTTPINLLYYNNNSFTGSTIIQQRQKNNTDCKLTAPSRVFKVVFLGDSGVGKTSLIHRLSCGKFTTPQSTLGLDYNTCIVPVGDEQVVFQLWDTAGQERFQSTTAVYFRRADAFIVVYDVTNKHSYKSIKSWISLVKATLRSELPVVMLMGNKTDKQEQRMVAKEEGSKLALELCAMFSETSALSGDNVLQAHATLASLLLERENQDIEEIKRSALRLDKVQQKRRCKC